MVEATRTESTWIGGRSSWRVLSVVLTVLALVLVGCGAASDPASTPTAEPPTSTTQPTPALQLGQVVFAQALSADGAALDPQSEIPRSTASIYAVVDVVNAQPGTSFAASWTIDGTEIPALDSQTTLEVGAASGQVAFHLTWDGATLWPVGTLGVTITASSGETVSGTVQIVST